MDNKQFIIELIKFGAWPIVAGVVIYYLMDKISSIFSGGVKSAKHGGTEIQFFETNQSIKPTSEDQQNLQHLIPNDPTGLREEQEGKINQQLDQIINDNDKIDILVKNLSQQQISNAIDKVYYNIYGSQIRLLEFLSVQAEGKASVHTVTHFYESAKHNNPEVYESYQFSNYMGFLLSWALVKNENDKWGITKEGRAFITSITAMQLNKNKAF